jgi:hypothetical protein
MANSNGWGDGAANNTIGWGQGANNAIGWGDIHADSWAGATDIVGVQAASLLLDTYTGAAVAYSLRQLRTAYTGAAIRVRRSSDNAEQDINFVSGDLDTSSLLTFCGAGNGFITTWYDQSGNALNLVRGVATQQPKIVSSGVVEVKNLKSTITFDGTDDVLSYISPISAINSGNEFAIYSVYNNNTTGTLKTFWTSSTSGSNNQIRGFGDTRTSSPLNFFISNSAGTSFSSTLSIVRNNTDQRLQVSVMDSGNVMRGFDNGATGGTATYTLTYANAIFQIGNGANGALSGGVQEFIIFDTNQLSNRTAIETNINDYYSIY